MKRRTKDQEPGPKDPAQPLQDIPINGQTPWAKELRALMERWGDTPESLAAELECSTTATRLWLSGCFTPPPETQARLRAHYAAKLRSAN